VVGGRIVDMTQRATIDITGPYDLREIALMGFGHRDESSFDGVMRMAFCLDGDYERPVGVAALQADGRLELTIESAAEPLSEDEIARVRRQVARVVSLDHDGEAFHQLCLANPALAAVHARAPGFRPALFYSPYEAAIWSVISARRPRAQGITLRTRLAEQYGTAFELAGSRTLAVPGPSHLLAVEAVPGLPADRIPRLHAIAEAASRGDLDAEQLRNLSPEQARIRLQQLPGIGPFYSSLIVIRACGHADVPAPEEGRSRAAIQQAYGIDHDLSDAELAKITETWKPFRTWVTVMMRALSDRTPASVG
jgi:DNA-3-methyladenine glycosylase II